MARINRLTGWDSITVRDLYSRPVTFRPEFTFWIAGNHRPRVPDDDDAAWERLREVPFTTVIPPEDRDPDVKRRLSDPAIGGPAVLAWAVQGCIQTNPFAPSNPQPQTALTLYAFPLGFRTAAPTHRDTISFARGTSVLAQIGLIALSTTVARSMASATSRPVHLLLGARGGKSRSPVE